MTWAEKFPHPGGVEPLQPPPSTDLPAVHAFNEWLRKARKHTVAQAVDALTELKKARGGILNGEQAIALVLGLSYLDDNDANNIFGMLLR